MGTRNGVPVHTRRASSRLRELRQRSGFTEKDVSRALGISMSKVSRMESGHRALKTDDVAALLGLYRIPARERQEVLSIVRDGSETNWWTSRSVPTSRVWDDLKSFESEAVVLRSYETMLVPGLLQTPDYVEAITAALAPASPAIDIDALQTQRVERQLLLHSDRRYEFLVEQAVLDRHIGSAEVMYHQYQRMSALADRSNITLRVVPTKAGAHAGLTGPLLYFEFPEHEDLLLSESRSSASYVEDPRCLADAREALQMLRKVALSPEESANLIKRVSNGLERQP